ncbi:hypothetical protein HZU95_000761 [Listeria monocytogenes]|nr:hypothetical protein [Listeria monocytogenes]
MKQHQNLNIWIEAEAWDEDNWDMEDSNLDVIVTFSNRSKWIATFFTYKNIQSLQAKNKQTGECMNGTYFFASDMILIDNTSRERVYEVIAHLMAQEEFETAFTKYPDVDKSEDYLYPTNFFKNSY